MHEIVSPQQRDAARQFRQLLSSYQQNRDLISIGAYQRGSDPRIDAAIALWPAMQQFLQQDLQEKVTFNDSVTSLNTLLGAARAS